LVQGSAERQAETSTAGAGQMDILATAAACFMERGYYQTSIDDVARRLGATKGRIYHHYPSKAELFFAVYRHGMMMNFEAVQPWIDFTGPAVEQLRHMLTAHCRSMVFTRPFQRVVWEGVELHLRGATTPEQRVALTELVEMRVRYAAQFRAVMRRAEAEGAIDCGAIAISEQLMFLALNAPIFGLAPRPGDTDDDRERIVRTCVEFALKGLGWKEERSR
jgi:AcrR family transcriptional regulator